MGRRVLRRHILGYPVCLCPIKGTPGLNELKWCLEVGISHMRLTVFVKYTLEWETNQEKQEIQYVEKGGLVII